MKMNFSSFGVMAICAVMIFAAASPAFARQDKPKTVVWGAVEGAIVGGILGNVFGDKKDGKKAAKVGAFLGALNAAAKKEKERERRERAHREQLRRIEEEKLALQRQALAQQQAARPVPTPSTAPAGSSMTTVEIISSAQRSLIVLGFFEPPVTGRFSPELRSAIQMYQKVSGLPDDGLPTEALVRHLQANGG